MSVLPYVGMTLGLTSSTTGGKNVKISVLFGPGTELIPSTVTITGTSPAMIRSDVMQ